MFSDNTTMYILCTYIYVYVWQVRVWVDRMNRVTPKCSKNQSSLKWLRTRRIQRLTLGWLGCFFVAGNCAVFEGPPKLSAHTMTTNMTKSPQKQAIYFQNSDTYSTLHIYTADTACNFQSQSAQPTFVIYPSWKIPNRLSSKASSVQVQLLRNGSRISVPQESLVTVWSLLKATCSMRKNP